LLLPGLPDVRYAELGRIDSFRPLPALCRAAAPLHIFRVDITVCLG